MTRIIVTGSRDLTDADLVLDVLSELFEEHEDITVIHGGARGADSFAHQWAILMRKYGVKEEVYNADWRTHDAACPAWHHDLPTCRMAGRRRNQQMVDRGADLVVAFYKGDSENRGTQHCVDRAHLARIRVLAYTQP